MPFLPLLRYMNVHKNDEILRMCGQGSLPPMTLNPKPEVLRLLHSLPEIDSPNPSCGLSGNRYQAARVPIYLIVQLLAEVNPVWLNPDQLSPVPGLSRSNLQLQPHQTALRLVLISCFYCLQKFFYWTAPPTPPLPVFSSPAAAIHLAGETALCGYYLCLILVVVFIVCPVPQSLHGCRTDSGHTVTLANTLVAHRTGAAEAPAPCWSTTKGTWGRTAARRTLNTNGKFGIKLVPRRTSTGITAYSIGTR